MREENELMEILSKYCDLTAACKLANNRRLNARKIIALLFFLYKQERILYTTFGVNANAKFLCPLLS